MKQCVVWLNIWGSAIRVGDSGEPRQHGSTTRVPLIFSYVYIGDTAILVKSRIMMQCMHATFSSIYSK